ncbi:MAG: Type 1 glutamine amidotransferase-like domain-containing protein [Chloroflexi bacterium]|nr:Type 1 glutamine amidotransferase-like domain-containing protein [Chloroflexota bacterium]
MGYILLAGGAEFGGRMSEPDLRAIELAGGFAAPICILPTAAAADNNHVRAGNNSLRWFRSLGATDVEVASVIDQASANDEVIAAALRSAKLIYLLGGFPRFTAETLANSLAWKSMLDAHRNGAVLAGSSAGAMVLCEHYFDPYEGKLLSGLGLVPNACVLPHHNNFGHRWAAQLTELLPGATLIGIDEHTGMISAQDEWTVHGAGQVTLYRSGRVEIQKTGAPFKL